METGLLGKRHVDWRPLDWTPGARATIHQVLRHKDKSLELISADAPVFRLTEEQQKLALSTYNVYLDHTDLSRQAANLKRTVRSLNSADVKINTNFASCKNDNCLHLFLMLQDVSYTECMSFCGRKHAFMLKSLDILPEVYEVYGQNVSTLWIDTQQRGYSDGYYGIRMKVKVGNYSILPKNTFSATTAANTCYFARVSSWQSIDCTSLPSKTQYFAQINGTYDYYSQSTVKLQVKVELDESYSMNRQMNLTNMSYLEYQRQHSKFRLFLATSRDILPPAGATGQCVCHKPKALY